MWKSKFDIYEAKKCFPDLGKACKGFFMWVISSPPHCVVVAKFDYGVTETDKYQYYILYFNFKRPSLLPFNSSLLLKRFSANGY